MSYNVLEIGTAETCRQRRVREQAKVNREEKAEFLHFPLLTPHP